MKKGGLVPWLLGSILWMAEGQAAKEVERAPAPDWVSPAEYELPGEAEDGNGSARYLVVDMQRHLEEETFYSHYVTQLVTEAGVEEYSQLSFSFQPEYQTLVLHHLDVLRGGERQNRLEEASVEVMRQERGLDRQLYDGELTAHIILEDIRPGDVLSYAYSLRGSNPVFRGHVHAFYQLGYGSPLAYLRRMVIWDPEKRSLQWQMLEAEEEAGVQDGPDGLKTLLWEQRDLPKMAPEDNTPRWHIDYPWLEISDYASWEEFGAWGNGIYMAAEELPEELRKLCDGIKAENGNREEQVVRVLRWVQGNVRYLGSFLGEHTHEPHRLEDVARRRFGDCKDKGMMVVAMLRYLGFDAAAAVVNTGGRQVVDRYLPGHTGFDHLIVHLELDGEEYWLDPTMTFQRGRLQDLYTPDYGYAFVMREGEAALREVKPRGYEVDVTVIEESFTVPTMLGGAELHVKTVATGRDADVLRRTFATETWEEVEESYRDFYAKNYSEIEVATPLSMKDDEELNRIEIAEHYQIKNFWEEVEDTEHEAEHEGWFSASFLNSYLRYPDKEERKQPYALPHHEHIRHIIRANLPGEWELEDESRTVELPSLRYTYRTSSGTDRLELHYEYQSLADAVLPRDFTAFQETMAALGNDLSYGLEHWDEAEETVDEEAVAKSNVLLLSLVAAGVLLGCGAACGLYFWNPAAREATTQAYRGLSGWLVLPIIGCFLLPLILLLEIAFFFYEIGSDGFALYGEGEDRSQWRLYFGFGVFSDSVLLPLSILLLVLLFGKRTSFPYLYIAFGVLVLGAEVLLLSLEGLVEVEEPSRPAELGGSVVRLILWGSYMMVSQRVRATFVRRRGEEHASVPPPVPAQGQV